MRLLFILVIILSLAFLTTMFITSKSNISIYDFFSMFFGFCIIFLVILVYFLQIFKSRENKNDNIRQINLNDVKYQFSTDGAYSECKFEDDALVYQRYFWKKRVNYSDIVWAHIYVQKTQVYSIFPVASITGRRIWIYDSKGERHDFRSKNDVEEIIILKEISKHVPHAIIGFSEQLKQIWEKDNSGFIKEVEKRKKNRVMV